MKVEVHATKKATKKEREMFLKAAEALGKALSSYEFWLDMEKIFYESRYRGTKLINNGGIIAFKEFKELVISGRDKFNREEDKDIDVSVEFYYSRKKVVGYTYPNTWFTWINRNVFKNYDIGDIAGNIFHEYLHNLGFGHPGASRASLVYKAGYGARDFIKNPPGAAITLDNVEPQKNEKRGIFDRVLSFFRRLF